MQSTSSDESPRFQVFAIGPIDENAQEVIDLIEATLNTPLSSEAQALLDRLPTRYEPDDPCFTAWVRTEAQEAGLPLAAADRLIAESQAGLWDTYPDINTGRVKICPAVIPFSDEPGYEPRMTLIEWWKRHGIR